MRIPLFKIDGSKQQVVLSDGQHFISLQLIEPPPFGHERNTIPFGNDSLINTYDRNMIKNTQNFIVGDTIKINYRYVFNTRNLTYYYIDSTIFFLLV